MNQLDTSFLSYISPFIHGGDRIFIYLFFVFLKQEKIYNFFMTEFSKRRNSTGFYAMQKCPYPKDLIVNAFCWVDTAHGRSFWVEIEEKWRKMLKSYNL